MLWYRIVLPIPCYVWTEKLLIVSEQYRSLVRPLHSKLLRLASVLIIRRRGASLSRMYLWYRFSSFIADSQLAARVPYTAGTEQNLRSFQGGSWFATNCTLYHEV
jgi:hypothetical protein